MKRIHLYLLFLFTSFSINTMGQDYMFWLNKGDCSAGTSAGLFTDTTSTIDIDCDDCSSFPDSVIYSFGDEKIKAYPPFNRISLRPATTDSIQLHAQLYTKHGIVELDTSFNVVHIPKVEAKIIRRLSADDYEYLEINLYDEYGNRIEDDFLFCFTAVSIYDENKEKITNWAGNATINLSRLIEYDPVQFRQGYWIKVEWARLLDLRVNRSFILVIDEMIQY